MRLLRTLLFLVLAFSVLAVPARTPLFATLPGTPGDENWDERFDALGANGAILALAAKDGLLYAGGRFNQVGSVPTNHVARFDPLSSTWSALGSGIGSADTGNVLALAILGNSLYVGGRFDVAGGSTAKNVARFDLTTETWSSVGTGLDGPVFSLATDGTNLYASGAFKKAGNKSVKGVARWDGTHWSALGGGINCQNVCVKPRVHAIAVKRQNVYVGGYFDQAGDLPVNNIAHWDGAHWNAMAEGIDGEVHALVFKGKKLFAGGTAYPERILRWNGERWTRLRDANGFRHGDWIYALYTQNNSLYVGSGRLEDSPPQEGIAQWDGKQFVALGQGISGGDFPPLFTSIRSIQAIGHDIFVGGSFTTAGGKQSHFIGLWHEPIP